MKRQSAVVAISPTQRAVSRILGWPRFGRIVLVSLFTLATALLLQPIIDNIYLTYFFPWESAIVTDFQRQIPSLITVAIALVVFILGWWLMVGFAGTTQTPRTAVLIYFVVGIVIVLISVIQVITGLVAVMPS